MLLPDGGRRKLAAGSTPAQLAAAIAPSLARRTVAARVDDRLVDADAPLAADCRVELIERRSPEALELIRHDLAHVLAQAVTELFPQARPTIGPVIENGFYYDFDCPDPFTQDDLARIEARMREIVDAAIPLQRELWSREKARKFFAGRGEKFKVELVDAIAAGEPITMYRQGDFIDLCRGPHMPTTRHAGKAFKLMRVAGSYWRGDSRLPQLQRIYGTAWHEPEQLQGHLRTIAEAERRDHRKVGVALGLFHICDDAPGSIFWHDRGWTVYRLIEDYLRARQRAAGYTEVKTPQLIDRSLWEKSGHWAKFGEHMYLVENRDGIAEFAARQDAARIFGLKPMNCPGHVQIFRRGVKSYRDLPLRMSEFGNCHRCEPTGALHGLMRVRAFTQDDAHIFCTPGQVIDETAAFMRLLATVYRDFGFESFAVRLADRPKLRSGSDATWDAAEQALKAACTRAGIDWQPNPGEGAFYGPKLEFVLRDAIGREWQCGTWQVDFVLPESLDAEYVDADGGRKRPVMLHRAILGSFERFIGILIEHCDGRLPLWLAPVQATVATITGAADAYAETVAARLEAAGLRVTRDLRGDKIGYKVREHSLLKVPALIAVGERDAAAATVAVRRLGERRERTLPLAEAAAALAAEAVAPHRRDC